MVITFAISNVGFTTIVRAIEPVLMVCYPALIVLAIFNLMYKLWDVQIVKIPVFGTFFTVLFYHLYGMIR